MLVLMLIKHVLTDTENNSDISIGISIRRTQGFDILMLMLMLMSWPSSLAHKLLMLVLMLASLVRTGLKTLNLVMLFSCCCFAENSKKKCIKM